MLKQSPAKIKIVFDTNIYIAAFLRDGLSAVLMRKAVGKSFELVASKEILAELSRKLIKKFGYKKSLVLKFINSMSGYVTIVKPSEIIDIIREDDSDNRILEAAVEGSADLIVSMDKYLLKLKKYKGIAIVHPKTLSWIVPE